MTDQRGKIQENFSVHNVTLDINFSIQSTFMRIFEFQISYECFSADDPKTKDAM